MSTAGIRTQAHSILTGVRGDTVPAEGEQEPGWWECGVRRQRGRRAACLSLLPLAPALQLEQALDTGVLGQLGGPGGFILSTLWNPSGRLLALKGRAILCILGALLAKRDIQGAGVGEESRGKASQGP